MRTAVETDLCRGRSHTAAPGRMPNDRRPQSAGAPLARAFLSTLVGLCFAVMASEPFVAPAVPSGTMKVKLHPTEVVAAGTPVVVTFGVPFTRGSIGDVSTVRVLRGGAEVPAYVEALAPWRHFHSAALNGNSVRIARVQMTHTFTQTFPAHEEITIEWGTTPRTKNVTQYVDPRGSWHKVTSGTFAAADNISEPDVYAVLPREVMCTGALKPTRMLPWHESVADTMDPAGWLDANLTKMEGYRGYDFAQKNLIYSVCNLDPAGEGDYMEIRTNYAAWLFDRASTIYTAYFRGGLFTFLREAVRNADYYQERIYRTGRASGAFMSKVPDPSEYIGGNGAMYSYLECIEYTHWLTGDDSVLTLIPLMVDLFDRENEPTHWTPNGAWGQERHTAFELLANVCAFEVTGEDRYRANCLRIMGDYIYHQNGSGGQIDSILGPSGAARKIDGALLHFGRQHDWDWDVDSLGASPWMSALAIDAMLRLYHMEESDSLKMFFGRFGSFLARTVKTYDDQAHGTSWLYPPYTVYYDGVPGDSDPWSDPRHLPEIGVSVAWGNYFADIAGQPDVKQRQMADSAYRAALGDFAGYCIRPGNSPEYWVQAPPRMPSWQFRPSGSWSWLARQSGAAATTEEHSERAGSRGGAMRLAIRRASGRNMVVTVGAESLADGVGGATTVAIFDPAGRRVAQVASPQWRPAIPPTGIYFVKVTHHGRSCTTAVPLTR